MTGGTPADGTPEPALEPKAFGIGILFYNTRDAVVVGDARSGRVVLWSPSAERIFGYPAREARGMLLEALVPPSLSKAHRAGLRRFAATGHGALIDGDALVELPALRKTGEEITVELTLTRVSGPGPYVQLVRDATERKQAEAERLHLAREQAARAEAEAGQRRATFLADAGAVLASSLDYEATLGRVARLVTPNLADYCFVYVDDERRIIRDVAVAHVDPEREEWLRRMRRQYPPDPEASFGVAAVSAHRAMISSPTFPIACGDGRPGRRAPRHPAGGASPRT